MNQEAPTPRFHHYASNRIRWFEWAQAPEDGTVNTGVDLTQEACRQVTSFLGKGQSQSAGGNGFPLRQVCLATNARGRGLEYKMRQVHANVHNIVRPDSFKKSEIQLGTSKAKFSNKQKTT